MIKRRIVLMATVLLALLSSACKKQTENPSEIVDFQTIRMEKNHSIAGNPNKPSLFIQLEYQFPAKYSNSQVLEKIRRHILNDYLPNSQDSSSNPEPALNASIKNRIRFFETTEKSFSDEDLTANEQQKAGKKSTEWWDKTIMSIRYNANNLISYTIRFDQYAGDDRATITLQNVVIDLKTGEKIHEEDLFAVEAIPLIHRLILKTLEQQNKVESADELEQIGYFDISEIGQYKNFCLTDKGIVYTFNACEIGSYDLGTIDVELSYDDLKDFLSAGSPLNRLYR